MKTMKKVKLFEDYVEIQNEIFNIDENQYDDTIEDLDSIIENAEELKIKRHKIITKFFIIAV